MTTTDVQRCHANLSGQHFYAWLRVSETLQYCRCGKWRSTLPPVSRPSDPETSHQAERAITESGKRESHAQQCLRALRERPGMTAGEVGEATGLGHVPAQRRLSDLLRLELVAQGAPRDYHGRAQVTWAVSA